MADDVVGKIHPLSQEGWTIFSINTREKNIAKKAEQNRTEQNRTEQNRTEEVFKS